MRATNLLFGTVSILAMAVTSGVQAQEAPATPVSVGETASSETDSEIVVTGSRLATTNLSSPQPVVGIGAEDIARSGRATASEVLNELPQLGNAFGASNQDIS